MDEVTKVPSPSTEPENAEAQKNADLVRYWLNQMGDALKREKQWRKEAREVLDIYEAVTEQSFNILYSNTETLMPALYSATPKPATVRRIKSEPSPVAAAAADMLNKSLQWTLDTNDDEFCEFDSIMSGVVLSSLVPGRGQAWFNYDAKFVEVPSKRESKPEEDLEELQERDTPSVDQDEEKTIQKVANENIHPELVPYDQFLYGYAKTWKRVPWVARVYIYTKTDMDATWPEVSRLVTYKSMAETVEADEQPTGQNSNELDGAPMVCTVYQIWDKTTRKVYNICDGYECGPLEEPIDDPLGLSGFFPCPEPLVLARKVRNMIPVPLYKFYKAQAKELEEITRRLKGLIRAMRVRGMYSALIDDIAKVLDAEENVLVPITNAAGLDKGLSASIFLVPIQDYVPVIQELWNQRQQVKQVIYEVTGISDIIRGASVASETATAQDIKNRWGTLRLQDMQGRVQKFARNCIRIMAEIMCSQYDKEKFADITGVKLPSAADKMQIQQALQQQPMPPAQPPQPGQPPQQPQLPPQVKQILESPTWEDVIAFLRNSVQRQYRIDIETDSTLADDVKQDKAELAEIMTGLTQMIQALTPAVTGGFLPFDAAKSFIIAFVARFRLGQEVEDTLLKAVQPPPPGQQDQDAAKQQQQMEMQQAQQEFQMKQQQDQQRMQMEQAKMVNDQRMMQMELEMAERKHAMEMEKMALQHQVDMESIAAKRQATADAAQAKIIAAQVQNVNQQNRQNKAKKGNGNAAV